MSMLPAAVPGARAGRDPARAIRRGPSRLPREVVAATQRDRLYDGLVHTVAAKGYGSARISDICLAAGVTRPAFYALFAGKEEAFLATYRHGTTVLLEVMDQAYQAAPDWRAGLREVLRILLDVLTAVPAFARMAIVEIDAAGPAAWAARDRVLDGFGRFFEGAPELPAAPPEIAGQLRREVIDAVVGGAYSTIRRYVADRRTDDLATLLPSLSYFLMAPFAGREAAGTELRATEQSETKLPICIPLDRLATER
jgi:AcrR family transcriptional regulator